RQSHSHGTFDASMSSTAGDFRGLTRRLLVRLMARAGTRVEEPVHRFELETPEPALGAVLRAVAQLHGVPSDVRDRSGMLLVTGDVPAAQVAALRRRLPTLTRGEGTLVTTFSHHRPAATGPARRQ
ncbi:MAG TPA: GTP-binding protein, partial [Segeticoccus sp.]|nr:GTP-binding protein [Segeticoccus sp.]